MLLSPHTFKLQRDFPVDSKLCVFLHQNPFQQAFYHMLVVYHEDSKLIRFVNLYLKVVLKYC